jgi:hypothetical protein
MPLPTGSLILAALLGSTGGRNMLHWKSRLACGLAAALVVISAVGGFGWSWY